ncbi:MAG: PPC domain-containing DNA-binding protein [Candidatus Njordarchaeia archaeon]
MKIYEENNTVVIVLEKGEKIIESLKKIGENLNLIGNFTGIGAVAWATLGFGDPKTGKYITKTFSDEYELLALTGNITVDTTGERVVHAHIILGEKNFNVIGGHLVEGEVSITAEIFFNRIKTKIKRKKVEGTEFKLIM